MFYKIHYNFVVICPQSYIQHAYHISSRTYHLLKYCNMNPLQINAYNILFFPRIMNIWNLLPCSHVTPSVDNFSNLIYLQIQSCSLFMVLLSFKFHNLACFFFFYIPIVSNSVLFTSYLYIFFLVCSDMLLLIASFCIYS